MNRQTLTVKGTVEMLDGIKYRAAYLLLEVTKGRQGESVRPFQIRSVKYNERIEDWMFTEDMPGKK